MQQSIKNVCSKSVKVNQREKYFMYVKFNFIAVMKTFFLILCTIRVKF